MLLKHLNDRVSDDRIINNDIVGFTETKINPSDSTFKITETLSFLILILITTIINFYVYLTDVT